MKLTPLLAVAPVLLLLTASCDRSDSTAAGSSGARAASTQPAVAGLDSRPATVTRVVKADDEWRRLLTAERFDVLRQQGTEPPFHNAYYDNHAAGEYRCAACGLALFESGDKFESGTGWPSFTRAASDQYVLRAPDGDGQRTELRCARCGGHLGHVFDDGPRPTGLRFCIDSASLVFVPEGAGAAPAGR